MASEDAVLEGLDYNEETDSTIPSNQLSLVTRESQNGNRESHEVAGIHCSVIPLNQSEHFQSLDDHKNVEPGTFLELMECNSEENTRSIQETEDMKSQPTSLNDINNEENGPEMLHESLNEKCHLKEYDNSRVKDITDHVETQSEDENLCVPSQSIVFMGSNASEENASGSNVQCSAILIRPNQEQRLEFNDNILNNEDYMLSHCMESSFAEKAESLSCKSLLNNTEEVISLPDANFNADVINKSMETSPKISREGNGEYGTPSKECNMSSDNGLQKFHLNHKESLPGNKSCASSQNVDHEDLNVEDSKTNLLPCRPSNEKQESDLCDMSVQEEEMPLQFHCNNLEVKETSLTAASEVFKGYESTPMNDPRNDDSKLLLIDFEETVGKQRELSREMSADKGICHDSIGQYEPRTSSQNVDYENLNMEDSKPNPLPCLPSNEKQEPELCDMSIQEEMPLQFHCNNLEVKETSLTTANEVFKGYESTPDSSMNDPRNDDSKLLLIDFEETIGKQRELSSETPADKSMCHNSIGQDEPRTSSQNVDYENLNMEDSKTSPLPCLPLNEKQESDLCDMSVQEEEMPLQFHYNNLEVKETSLVTTSEMFKGYESTPDSSMNEPRNDDSKLLLIDFEEAVGKERELSSEISADKSIGLESRMSFNFTVEHLREFHDEQVDTIHSNNNLEKGETESSNIFDLSNTLFRSNDPLKGEFSLLGKRKSEGTRIIEESGVTREVEQVLLELLTTVCNNVESCEYEMDRVPVTCESKLSVEEMMEFEYESREQSGEDETEEEPLHEILPESMMTDASISDEAKMLNGNNLSENVDRFEEANMVDLSDKAVNKVDFSSQMILTSGEVEELSIPKTNALNQLLEAREKAAQLQQASHSYQENFTEHLKEKSYTIGQLHEGPTSSQEESSKLLSMEPEAIDLQRQLEPDVAQRQLLLDSRCTLNKELERVNQLLLENEAELTKRSELEVPFQLIPDESKHLCVRVAALNEQVKDTDDAVSQNVSEEIVHTLQNQQYEWNVANDETKHMFLKKETDFQEKISNLESRQIQDQQEIERLSLALAKANEEKSSLKEQTVELLKSKEEKLAAEQQVEKIYKILLERDVAILELTNALKESENKFIQVEKESINENCMLRNELENNKIFLEKALNEATEREKELQTKITFLQDQLSKNHDILEEIRAQNSQLEYSFQVKETSFDQHTQKLNEELAWKDSMIMEVHSKLEDVSNRLSKKDKEQGEMKLLLEHQELEISKYKHALIEAERQLAEMQDSFQKKLNQEISEKNEELSKLTEVLEMTKHEMLVLQNSNEETTVQFTEERDALKNTIEERDARIGSLEQKIYDMNNVLQKNENLEETQRILQEEILDKNALCSSYEATLKEIKQELGQVYIALQDMESRKEAKIIKQDEELQKLSSSLELANKMLEDKNKIEETLTEYEKQITEQKVSLLEKDKRIDELISLLETSDSRLVEQVHNVEELKQTLEKHETQHTKESEQSEMIFAKIESELKVKVANLENQILQHQTEISALSGALQQANNEVATGSQIIEELKKEVLGLEKLLKEKENDLCQLRTVLKENQERNDYLEESCNKSRAAEREFKEKIAQLSEKIVTLEQNLEYGNLAGSTFPLSETMMFESDEKIIELEESLGVATNKITEQERSIKNMEEELIRSQAQVSEKENMHQSLLNELKNSVSKLEELKKCSSQWQESYQTLKTQLEESETKVFIAEKQLKLKEVAISQLNATIEEVEQQLQEQFEESQILSSVNATLQNERDALRKVCSKYEKVNKILESISEILRTQDLLKQAEENWEDVLVTSIQNMVDKLSHLEDKEMQHLEMEEKVLEYEIRIGDLEQQVNGQLEKTEALEKERSEALSINTTLQREISRKEQKIEQLSSENEITLLRLSAAEDNFSTIIIERESLQAKLCEAVRHEEDLLTELKQIQQHIMNINGYICHLSEENERLAPVLDSEEFKSLVQAETDSLSTPNFISKVKIAKQAILHAMELHLDFRQKEAENLKKELDNIKILKNELEEQVQCFRDKVSNLELEKMELVNNLQTLKEAETGLKQEIESLNLKLLKQDEEKRVEISLLEENLQNVIQEKSALAGQVLGLKCELNEMVQSTNITIEELNQKLAEFDNIKDEVKSKDAELKLLRDEAENVSCKLQNYECKIEKLQKMHEAAQKEIAKTRYDLEVSEKRCADFKIKMEELEKQQLEQQKCGGQQKLESELSRAREIISERNMLIMSMEQAIQKKREHEKEQELQLTSTIQKKQEVITALQQELEGYKEKLRSENIRQTEIEDHLRELESNNEELKKRVSIMQDEKIKIIASHEAVLKEREKKSEEAKNDLSAKLHLALTNGQAWEKKCAHLKSRLDALEEKCMQPEEVKVEVSQQLKSLQEQLHEKDEELEKRNEENLEVWQRYHKTVMQLQKEKEHTRYLMTLIRVYKNSSKSNTSEGGEVGTDNSDKPACSSVSQTAVQTVCAVPSVKENTQSHLSEEENKKQKQNVLEKLPSVLCPVNNNVELVLKDTIKPKSVNKILTEQCQSDLKACIPSSFKPGMSNGKENGGIQTKGCLRNQKSSVLNSLEEPTQASAKRTAATMLGSSSNENKENMIKRNNNNKKVRFNW